MQSIELHKFSSSIINDLIYAKTSIIAIIKTSKNQWIISRKEIKYHFKIC